MKEQEKINSIYAKFRQGAMVTFYHRGQWYWGKVKSCIAESKIIGRVQVTVIASIHDENSRHPHSFMFRKGREIFCTGRTDEIDNIMSNVIISGWELVE